METGIRAGHVVHLSDDPVHRAVGDDHHPGRVDGHGEVGQQLKRTRAFIKGWLLLPEQPFYSC